MASLDDKLSISAPRYSCRIANELPGAGKAVFHYPGATTTGGRDGILVEVKPADAPSWLGMFEFGDGSLNALLSAPNSEELCVVSRGRGFIVSSLEPEHWYEIPISPVLWTHLSEREHLLLFHDFTDFVAVGEAGVAWRSRRVSIDGIKVDAIEGDTLLGRARDVVSGGHTPFRLNIHSGEHEGGTGA